VAAIPEIIINVDQKTFENLLVNYKPEENREIFLYINRLLPIYSKVLLLEMIPIPKSNWNPRKITIPEEND